MSVFRTSTDVTSLVGPVDQVGPKLERVEQVERGGVPVYPVVPVFGLPVPVPDVASRCPYEM